MKIFNKRNKYFNALQFIDWSFLINFTNADKVNNNDDSNNTNNNCKINYKIYHNDDNPIMKTRNKFTDNMECIIQ